MPFRRDFSPIYIHKIADRLEQIEGNPDGKRKTQSQRLNGNGKPLQQRGHIFGKEVQVFKEKQQCGAQYHRQDQNRLPRGRRRVLCPASARFSAGRPMQRSFDIQRREIGDCGGKQKHGNVCCAPGGIEKIAGGQQQGPAPFSGKSPVQQEYDRQKNGVAEGIEQHGSPFLTGWSLFSRSLLYYRTGKIYKPAPAERFANGAEPRLFMCRPPAGRR